jgi:thiol-disulfide isomerase/thioredoxin
MSEKKVRPTTRWRSVLMATAAVTVIAGIVAVYEITGRTGNAVSAECTASAPRVAAIAPLAIGEVAGVMVPDAPTPVPDLAFLDDEGTERRLSDWRGQVALVNLWATWCAPCRYEMPALDNLQSELGGDDFEVVAINIDMGDADKPKQFLDEIGATRLAYYADPSTGVFRELKAAGRAFGMPTTLIVDRDGCELGHLAGPAEWDSEDALALIRAAVAAE